MRYFQVQPFIIDSELPQLHVDGQCIDMEPKLHQLLIYFCQNPNVIISRDQIIEKVNQGVVVSDNAVNKMVANLRQILGDNPRQAQFIKTIPKQGYSFIAPVTQCDKVSEEKPPVAVKSMLTTALIIAIAIIAISAVVFIGQTPEQSIQPSAQLVPLTRHSGVEFSPAISPDQHYLAYTRNDPHNQIQQLWLMDLQQNKPELLLAEQQSSGEIAWSSTSDKLIYTDYSDGRCRFMMVTLGEQDFVTTPIADCNARYVRQMMFYHNDQQLLHVSYEQGFESAQIFSLDLNDKSRRLIQQPTPEADGNYAFDLSPDGSKLLILSGDESYQTTIYQLDTQTQQLTKLAKWPRMLFYAVWDHDNESIIHTSNRYSHELLRSDIQGNKLATMVATSNRVNDNFARHPNGKDFYFTSFMMNNDNILVDMTTGARQSRFNSSVYDKLPAFGETTDKWYFSSKRVGVSQIFAVDSQSNTVKQLTHFTEEPDINGLDVSPDGSVLAMKDIKSIVLFNLLENSTKEIPIDAPAVLTLNWLSDKKMALSVLIDAEPRLMIYDFVQQTLVEPKWHAAFASPSGKRVFYVESTTNAVYEYFDKTGKYVDTGIVLPYTFAGGTLNVAASESAIVYGRNVDFKTELISVDLATGKQTSQGKWLFLAGFDIRDNRLILSYEHSRSGDIVTTRFE